MCCTELILYIQNVSILISFNFPLVNAFWTWIANDSKQSVLRILLPRDWTTSSFSQLRPGVERPLTPQSEPGCRAPMAYKKGCQNTTRCAWVPRRLVTSGMDVVFGRKVSIFRKGKLLEKGFLIAPAKTLTGMQRGVQGRGASFLRHRNLLVLYCYCSS